MTPLLYVLFPVVFALADRGIGGGFQRSIVVAFMLVFAIGLGLSGYGFAGVLTATWTIYRTLPWSIGGTITPRTPVQLAGAFARHAGPSVAVLGSAVWFGTPPQAALPLVIYGAIATGLAFAYARHVDEGEGDGVEANNLLEGVRGFLFGLAGVWALTM